MSLGCERSAPAKASSAGRCSLPAVNLSFEEMCEAPSVRSTPPNPLCGDGMRTGRSRGQHFTSKNSSMKKRQPIQAAATWSRAVGV